MALSETALAAAHRAAHRNFIRQDLDRPRPRALPPLPLEGEALAALVKRLPPPSDQPPPFTADPAMVTGFTYARRTLLLNGNWIWLVVVASRRPVFLNELTVSIGPGGAGTQEIVSIIPYLFPNYITADFFADPPASTSRMPLLLTRPDLPAGAIELPVSDGAPITLTVPLNTLSPYSESTAVARIQVDGPGSADVFVAISTRLPQVQPVVVPPVTQVSVLNTTFNVPSPPAPAGPSIPRGVRISVTQAGGTLYSRLVAWDSLAPSLQREFLDAQLAGRYPPTMQPVW